MAGDLIPGGCLQLLLLSFRTSDGSVIHWQEAEAHGDAPATIWHHTACSYAGGARVVVFGGDMERDDAQFGYIADRSTAAIVFLLNVSEREWARVNTHGGVGRSLPSWRSLHVAVSFAGAALDVAAAGTNGRAVTGASVQGSSSSAVSSADCLLILGGSSAHVRPFSSGTPAPLIASDCR